MVFQSPKIHTKTIALGIQARLGSKRFPRKIFAEVEPGRSLLTLCLEQAKIFKSLLSIKGWDVRISILCPQGEMTQIQKHLKSDEPLHVQEGDPHDVFSRYEMLNKWVRPHHLMRITADCPYWSAYLAARLITEMDLHDSDFGWIKTPSNFPDGLDVEVIRHDLWQKMSDAPKHAGITEHVTVGLKGEWSVKPLRTLILPKDEAYQLPFKLSIDTLEDLETIKKRRGEIWWIQDTRNLGPDLKLI